MKKKSSNISKNNQIMALIFIGVLLIVSALLMNSFSLSDKVDTVSFQSKSLNYENKEAGSFEVTKSTKWVSKGKARVDINIDTISKIENQKKDIILILDTSFGDNLVPMKKILLDFVEKILSNENNKIALITYDGTSSIRSGFVNNSQVLFNRINTLTSGSGNRNYYQALVSIDSILEDYTKENKEEINALFVTSGYSKAGRPNEKSYYEYLKWKYPNLVINTVWYGIETDVLDSMKNASDYQYTISLDNLENTLLDITNYTKEYDSFIFNDVINTNYFDINSITNIKLTAGTTEIEGNQLIWNLNSFHTGRNSHVTFDISLKEVLFNEVDMISPTKENIVTYRVDGLEEKITNQDNTKLPINYQVIYEDSKPSDCEIENFPSNEIKQVKEIVELSNNLKCNGYGFKGWTIITEEVESLSNNQFIMPESDVIVRAEWSKVGIEKSMDGTVLPGLPPAPVINTEKAGYPILTEDGVYLASEVSVDYSDRDDIDNYYSVDDGRTWQVYEGPFNRLSSQTVLAKSCLKDMEDDCVVSSKSIEMPSDALGLEAYDDNISSALLTQYNILYVSDSLDEIEEPYMHLIGYVTCNDVLPDLLTFYDIDDNQISQLVYTSNQPFNGNVLIPKGTRKMIFQSFDPGSWTINELYIDNSPVIKETKYYPTLTENGVQCGYNEVTIDYFKTSVKGLYRINEGEWWEYQNQPIRLEIGDTIEAKGVSKYEIESKSSSYISVLPEDALGPIAYDGDMVNALLTRYSVLYVSDSLPEMEEFYMYIIGYVTCNDALPDLLTFYDINDNQISQLVYTSNQPFNGNVLIPKGTRKMIFQSFDPGSWTINELYIDNSPVIKETKYYPTLTENGVQCGYNEVTIDYFKTSVRGLYRINEGEWQEYQNQPIRLEIGDKIEAKGIDKNSVDTKIADYTASLPVDALGKEAYDGDKTTYYVSGNGIYYLNVDESAWNQEFKATISFPQYYYCGWYMNMLDENNAVLETTGVGCQNGEVLFSVPEGTKRIGHYKEYNLYINEIERVINVDISYPSGYTNEYSLNFGGDMEFIYTGFIALTGPNTVFSRSLDSRYRYNEVTINYLLKN